MNANKKLVNREAIEFKLSAEDPDRNEERKLIHIEKNLDDEEYKKRHEKVIDQLGDFCKLPEGSTLNNDAKQDKANAAKKLEDLNEKEIDELFSKANIDRGVKVVEYNKWGIQKNLGLDKEAMDFFSANPFNPEEDEFIPSAVYHKPQDRQDIDIDPNTLDPDYREVFDILMKEEDNYSQDGGELEDNFLVLANGGINPVDLNDKSKEKQSKDPKQTNKELLDRKFNETYKEYTDEKEENPHKFLSKKDAREKLNEALEELTVDTKMPQIKDNPDDYNESEEYEEYDDEELEADDDYKELELQDGVPLLTNEERDKFLLMQRLTQQLDAEERENPEDEIKTKKYKEILTLEEIDRINQNPAYIDRTLQMILERGNEDNAIEEIQLPYPKEIHNIITEEEKLEIKNLPNKIPVNDPNYNKKLTSDEKKKLMQKAKEKVLLDTTANPNQRDPKNIEILNRKTDLESLEKKERKKLVKEENKEKRKKKKELKLAYKKEKTKVEKIIAESNKVIRNGLSIKEL